jgi:predicted transcriptional regulator
VGVEGPETIPPYQQVEVMLSVWVPGDPALSPAGTLEVPLVLLTGHPSEDLPIVLTVDVDRVLSVELDLPMLSGAWNASRPQPRPYEYSADLLVRDVGNVLAVHHVTLESSYEHPIVAVDLSQGSLMMVSGMEEVVGLEVRVDPETEPGVYSVRVDVTEGTDEPAWISIGFEVSGVNVSLLPDLVIVHDTGGSTAPVRGTYLVSGSVINPDELAYDSVEVSFFRTSDAGSEYLGSVPLENVSANSVLAYRFTLDVEEAGEQTVEVRLTVDGAAPVDPDSAVLVGRFEAVPEKTPEPEGVPSVVIVMGIAVGALAGILAIIGTEAGKFALMAFIIVPLYTRLKPEQVTDHFLRGQILGYVKANPGETYTHIRKALGVSNGQFVYHSRILESQGLIRSVKDGANRRFYPAGMRIPREVKDVQLNQVQRIIYTIILEYPGISQSKIAKMVQLAPSTVNYHVNIMSKIGVVERRRSGRLSLCFASQELD